MAPFGPKARNSSALARWESLLRPLRCRLIAASPWSVDLTIMGASVQRGRSRNGPGSGVRSKSWWAPAKLESWRPLFRRRLMPPYWAGPKIVGGWARGRTAKTGVAFTPILLERHLPIRSYFLPWLEDGGRAGLTAERASSESAAPPTPAERSPSIVLAGVFAILSAVNDHSSILR